MRDEFLVPWVDKRLNKRNRNWLGLVTGDTGSGKSYEAMRIAERVDPDWSMEKLIMGKPLELIKRLNDDELAKQGSVFIMDEAGVGVNNRKWYKAENMLLNDLLQTFRFKNVAVIFTVPFISFIDKKDRKLFHTLIQPFGLNKEKKYTIASVRKIQHNDQQGKTYWKYYKVGNKKYTRTRFKKPSKEITEKYEPKHKKWKNSLFDGAIEELEKMNEDKEKEFIKVKEDIKEDEDKLFDYLKESRGRIIGDQDLLHADYPDMSTRDRKAVKAALERYAEKKYSEEELKAKV